MDTLSLRHWWWVLVAVAVAILAVLATPRAADSRMSPDAVVEIEYRTEA